MKHEIPNVEMMKLGSPKAGNSKIINTSRIETS